MDIKKAAKEIAKKLDKPLCLWDLETTGASTTDDEIVQFHSTRIDLDGSYKEMSFKCKPKKPISEGATAVHGITNEEVEGLLSFGTRIPDIITFFKDADVASYNGIKFDEVITSRQMEENGQKGFFDGRRHIDIFNIYKKHSTRKLKDAVEYYLDEEMEDAHNASADVSYCVKILAEQLKREDKPIDEILNADKIEREKKEVERCFVQDKDSRWVFNFGKHKGLPVESNKGFFEMDA